MLSRFIPTRGGNLWLVCDVVEVFKALYRGGPIVSLEYKLSCNFRPPHLAPHSLPVNRTSRLLGHLAPFFLFSILLQPSLIDE